MQSQTRSTKWLWLIGLGVIVILVMMLAGPFSRGPAISMVTPMITQSPVASPSITSPGSPIPTGSSLPPTAETPTEVPLATDWPTPDEQATLDFLATDTAWKQLVALTAQQRLTDQPLGTPVYEPTGIYEGPEFKAQLHQDGFEVENVWWGIVNGSYILIYSGAHQNDLARGMLLIIEEKFNFYPTPLQAGSVHVVESQNDRLVLLSTNGTTFYFDVPTLQFVDSLTAIAPTYTPTSTATTTHTPGPTETPLPTCTPGPTPTANPPIPFVCN